MLPGGNPRDIVFHDKHIFIPHLGDRWPNDRNAAGYISVLDRNFTVVANLGGTTPNYRAGNLDTMATRSTCFTILTELVSTVTEISMWHSSPPTALGH